jgi:putative FmdB family regulatory protein
MPIYEYRCEDCDHRFEGVRPFQERDAAYPCPRCAGTRSQKLFSTSITFVRSTSSRVEASAAPEIGPSETRRAADYVEPRHPLPEHWSRYPRTLDEAI